MRPVGELFRETYWNIGFRTVGDGRFAFEDKASSFTPIRESKRYWYADPFLFSYGEKLWLFAEAFDNITEKGEIACFEYKDGAFGSPVIVLSEPFHLSYPFVFEMNGEVYMIPETKDDGCIQLYKAVAFPTEWKKDRILVHVPDAVDTVLSSGWLMTSRIRDAADMRVDLELYDFMTGTLHPRNPAVQNSQTARGAGAVFNCRGKIMRPAQDCTGAVYGAGLIFNEITETSAAVYSERETARLSPEDIEICGKPKPLGIHTYARLGEIEVVDFKLRRGNVRRIVWIIKKKFGQRTPVKI